MAAYNYYTPYQNQYQSQMQIPQMMQQQPQVPQQMQYPAMQNGFVRVPNENEARMYPVAPGMSVTFIDENQPYCYTKTMDRSQLDRPKFEKYRLVKEEDTPAPVQVPQGQVASVPDNPGYAMKTELEAFREEIEDRLSDIKAIQSDLKNLRDRVELLAEKKTTRASAKDKEE